MTIVADTRIGQEGKELLKSLIGGTLEAYRIDEQFCKGHVLSSGAVGLKVDGVWYCLTVDTEVVNYYGTPEDIAVVGFRKAALSDLESRLIGVRQIEIEVGKPIRDVVLLEDEESEPLEPNGYRFLSTAAVVVKLPRSEVVFELYDCFTPIFEVHRGPGASGRVLEPGRILTDKDRLRITANRSEVSLGSEPLPSSAASSIAARISAEKPQGS